MIIESELTIREDVFELGRKISSKTNDLLTQIF